MTTTWVLDHNADSPRGHSTSWVLDHSALVISPQLYKPKQIAQYPQLLAGEGLVAKHFEPGAISADASGRAIVAAGFFDQATVSDKFLDGSIPSAKVVGGGGGGGTATGAAIRKSVGIHDTIVSATATTILNYDTTDFNFGCTVDLANGKITVPTTGLYTIHWSGDFVVNGTQAVRQMFVQVNGADFPFHPAATAPGDSTNVSNTQMCGSTLVKLTAGDDLTLKVYQDSGANTDLYYSTLRVALITATS